MPMINFVHSLLKVLLIASFISINSLLIAQYAWPPNGTENKDYYLNQTDKKDGLHYRTYPEGGLYYAGEFLQGKPALGSSMYYYYEAGALMSKHEFISPTGVYAESFYENGTLMSTGHYENQLKAGIWEFYSENGTLASKESYHHDKKNGLSTIYYPEGMPYKTINYLNDVKEGEWQEFYTNKKLKGRGAYTHNQFHGPVKYFQESGLPLVEGNYLYGLKDGVWIKFTSTGKIEITTKYEKGNKIAERRENGSFTDYYDDGIPKAHLEYEDGTLNGPFTEFYDMGTWVRKPKEDSDPRFEVQLVEKLEGTQILREGDYLDGKLEGEIMYYDETGKVTKIERYEGGELVDTVNP